MQHSKDTIKAVLSKYWYNKKSMGMWGVHVNVVQKEHEQKIMIETQDIDLSVGGYCKKAKRTMNDNCKKYEIIPSEVVH